MPNNIVSELSVDLFWHQVKAFLSSSNRSAVSTLADLAAVLILLLCVCWHAPLMHKVCTAKG